MTARPPAPPLSATEAATVERFEHGEAAPESFPLAKCPIDCPCICHDTGGFGHGPGPCPTKLGLPVVDDWRVTS